MAVTITSIQENDLRVFGNIPLNENLYTAGQVESRLSGVTEAVAGMISTAISTVWKAGGSVEPSGQSGLVYESPSTGVWEAPLAIAENEGKVYHVTSDFDITSGAAVHFKEGVGTHIEAGTDVAVVYSGMDGASKTYIYDVLAVTDSSVVKSIRVGNSSGTELTPVNGTVTIPYVNSNQDGLLMSADKEKLDGISCGAEVNQNAFSKVAVSGESTVEADSKTDTLTFVAGRNISLFTNASADSVTIGATGVVAHISIPYSGYGSSSGSIIVDPSENGEVTLTHLVTMFNTDSGLVEADSCGLIGVKGAGGISVTQSGEGAPSIKIDGSAISGIASGAASGLAALKNFSKITVKDSSGNTVTNGEISPASNADTALGFKAGNYVTLTTSGENVVVTANPPVTDVKHGNTSYLSGTVAKIPTATSGAVGLVVVRDGSGWSETQEANERDFTVPTVHAMSGAVSERVSKPELHFMLYQYGLQMPASGTYSSGTLYALIAALHDVENEPES